MPSSTQPSRIDRFMWFLDARVIRFPWLILLLFLGLAGLTLRYTMDHLKVNTNTADMISLEVPFQKNRLTLEKAFPQDIGSGLLLIEGLTPEATSAAVDQITQRLTSDPAHFKDVVIPDGGPFFAREGLLYLSVEDLEDLSSQLAQAQPFIGRLAKDMSLESLLSLIKEALEASNQEDLPLDLNPLLNTLNEALKAHLEGRPYDLSWRQLMTPKATGLGVTKRLVLFKPVLHYEEVMPAESAIKALDAVIAETLQGTLKEVTVRKTGEVVLEHEEMETISNGVSKASIASLILVCLTLWLAYRSFKLVIATFISLTLGLVFSLGFATVAIGQLNLISIGFAVLFIGMGDAYSSHFCLRYRELILEGTPPSKALRLTMSSTAPALLLSAFTAAIGLFAFIPTRYSGVAELGIIAGASMFIALFTTFTVLPALMKILPINPPKKALKGKDRSRLSNWPITHAITVRRITFVLGLLALGLMLGVEVDFNPINLRDPDTESVKTFKTLLASKDTSPMSLAALAPNEQEAERLKAQFEALSTVDQVRTLKDLIPEDQEEKIDLIQNLALIMGSGLEDFPPPSGQHASINGLKALNLALEHRLAKVPDDPILQALNETLKGFLSAVKGWPADDEASRLQGLEHSLLGGLPKVIQDLGESLKAEPITETSLPPDLLARWRSPEGLYRLQIMPKEDLNHLNHLRAFIVEAQTVDPNVTDLPVTYLESMNEVITAFKEAFTIAFLATTIILLLVLRSLRDTLLVLLPLLLASLFTAAATVLFGVPFNFANIIALPLLFGLGVDSGIHMTHRLHAIQHEGGNLLDTSEAKGVFYGALTTIFSFSSLALTSHQGTASMGLLLSIGLLLTLICALVVLPAFSGIKPRRTP
ncbi:MAG: hypothetical protein D4R76_05575 [Methylococcus sp.]|jgi:hopanoid biosynthesis associated RND transporter like protein HpnN|nr:MAG: hypothetical protein D4R76_05575 [Methylococcus sp.]